MLIKVDRMQLREKLPVSFSENLLAITGYGILEKTQPVTVEGVLEKLEGYYSFEGNAKTEFTLECALCLKEVKKNLTFDVSFKFSQNLVMLESEDTWGFNSNVIDFEEAILSEIAVNMPTKVLCSDECKGLCPSCGQNLNLKDCGCSNEKTDERFAALNNFFRD